MSSVSHAGAKLLVHSSKTERVISLDRLCNRMRDQRAGVMRDIPYSRSRLRTKSHVTCSRQALAPQAVFNAAYAKMFSQCHTWKGFPDVYMHIYVWSLIDAQDLSSLQSKQALCYQCALLPSFSIVSCFLVSLWRELCGKTGCKTLLD